MFKRILFVFAVFFFLSSLVSQVRAVECDITVGKNEAIKSIQAGINSASSNQTVCVKYGTYNEVVTINKSGLKLIGISNTNGEKPIIDGEYRLPEGKKLLASTTERILQMKKKRNS